MGAHRVDNDTFHVQQQQSLHDSSDYIRVYCNRSDETVLIEDYSGDMIRIPLGHLFNLGMHMLNMYRTLNGVKEERERLDAKADAEDRDRDYGN